MKRSKNEKIEEFHAMQNSSIFQTFLCYFSIFFRTLSGQIIVYDPDPENNERQTERSIYTYIIAIMIVFVVVTVALVAFGLWRESNHF